MIIDGHDILSLLGSYADTRVALGEGALSQAGPLLEELGAKKLMIFTGGASADKSGAWDKFLRALGPGVADTVRFAGIEPEPSIQTVERMLAALEKEKPDQAAALGGGSAMDAAKAAWLTYQAGGSVRDWFGAGKFSSLNPCVKLKKVICFPTTAGTGSEVTPYSNIVDAENSVKKLIVETQIIPEYSFVDPDLTVSCPISLTRAVAFDALAHCAEGFLNVPKDSADKHANERALAGIKLIVKALPAVLRDPADRAARAMLSAAACLGGMVIRHKPTGLPHLCSFSWFGRIPHGTAVAMVLPHAWRYYLPEKSVAERTMELDGVFGPAGSGPESVVESYLGFIRSCGAPPSLGEVPDMTEDLIEKTASMAAQNKMKLETAPRPVPLEDSKRVLAEILKNAWRG
jgi:alcohol dehydrogenase class IV